MSNVEPKVQIRLSNDDISSILEDKRKSVMKIVYESLQMSVGRREGSGGNNTGSNTGSSRPQVKGEKKDIVRLIGLEEQINKSNQNNWRLPEIRKELSRPEVSE